MNISFRWLQSLAPELADPPERVAHRLTMYGAPVDEVIRLGDQLADVVVARVAAVRPHPNADRLSLCTVDAGSGEPIQVVCGAPNVRAGGYYPFAPVGATLPGSVAIRRVKIRGEESRGMLCSERELGLGREHGGIMELHGDWEPGVPFLAAVGLDDVRFVVDITANRPDLLSHLGVARELAPEGRTELPAFPGAVAGRDSEPEFVGALRTGRVAGIEVTIEDELACPRYLGAVVRGVRIAPSPAWLAARLRAVGLRPINNVVDATNYVLYELGQPLHAFDLNRLSGGAIRIRAAHPGESVITLDGERRRLQPHMLVIADAEQAVAIAGVMGGESSEVQADTTDIFLECALFDPRSVRRTRRTLGLSTDASYRFERGVDPEGSRRATVRALELILNVAGGAVAGPILDLEPHPRQAPVVVLRPERIARLLGTPLTPPQLRGYLEPLGFEALDREDHEDGRLWFRVPGHREYDVSQEIDLIEEVARRHGYDAFPQRPKPFRPSAIPEDPLSVLEDVLRDRLAARGFLEARTAAFAPDADGDVALLNPLSTEEGRLRRSLLAGLARRVGHNFARGVRHVRLFEIGTVFGPPVPGESLPIEHVHLAVAMTGARRPPHWTAPDVALDLWDLKGLVEELGELVAGPGSRVVPEAESPTDRRGPFVMGEAMVVLDSDGHETGRAGRLEESLSDPPPWADPVYGFELRLRGLPPAWRSTTYRPLPQFPSIERDLALLVPDAVAAAEVEAAIRGSAGPWLEHVAPFDLYRGAGVPAGLRSIAYRLRFRAPDRTLTDEDADHAVDRVLARLAEELRVQRRG